MKKTNLNLFLTTSIIVIFLLISFAGAKETYKEKQPDLFLPILYVYDGDTIRSFYEGLPYPLYKIYVRLDGIDTPEKGFRAECQEEKDKAEEVKHFLIDIIGNSKIMRVTNYKWDKYGGRILGTVFVNGVNLSEALIKAHKAREYHGEKKKSWCGIN